MKRYFSTILCISLFATLSVTADSYWVAFSDKNGTTGDIDKPEEFLSERTLARRSKYGIAIDSLDLPVSQAYIDSLRNIGASILFTSRWMNGATIETGDSSIVATLSQWRFVKDVERTQCEACYSPTHKRLPAIEQNASIDYGQAATQTNMLQLHKLHDIGYQGSGMHIAVIDNGFSNVDKSDYFAYVRPRIIHTRNFVNPQVSVYATGEHGSSVLSCMATKVEGYCGTAPEASYTLILTEDDKTEGLREVDAQVAAFEFADSIGADIITSSLGYAFDFDDSATNIPYTMLDGHHVRNSQAATIAARKGIVVCISAGNEGNKAWHYISSPADADSILTVGSVTAQGDKSPFSSFGPTADGRIKPDVCAMGTATYLYDPVDDDISTSRGTSFSTPIIAGTVACLWQALPDLNNMQIIQRIVKSATQAHNPDNAIGYGIPNVWAAFLGNSDDIKEAVNDSSPTQTVFYSLQGILIGTNEADLPPGIYIKTDGTMVHKMIVTK